MQNKTSVSMVVGLLLVLVGLAGIINLANDKFGPRPVTPNDNASTTPTTPDPGEVVKVVSNFEGFEKFDSEKDFKEIKKTRFMLVALLAPELQWSYQWIMLR
jgi:hypothetical protein